MVDQPVALQQRDARTQVLEQRKPRICGLSVFEDGHGWTRRSDFIHDACLGHAHAGRHCRDFAVGERVSAQGEGERAWSWLAMIVTSSSGALVCVHGVGGADVQAFSLMSHTAASVTF
eukprot:TRINITY_DN1780_c1_g1_i8.p3 TRINITY_DN1780_c1_g1~~TRINITY_DN1780_c1_g1_i8.p3  ORF type:complete len:118 (-),score=8.59 TRINITY_DN1780_c1_g1_i8:835-1188(-)